MELYESIKKSKAGDSDALLSIINKFKPLIKKYNYKFFSDDIESELIIAVIKCTEKIDLKKFNGAMIGELVNYYSVAIRNMYVDMVKKTSKRESYISLFEDSMLDVMAEENSIDKINSKLQFEELLKTLTPIQKEIMTDIFYYEKTEVEIAKKRNITKQAVCNLKRRSLKKLRESYIDHEEE